MKYISQYKWLILLLIISFLAHLKWLNIPLVNFGDTWYYFPETLKGFFYNFENTTWNGLTSIGKPVVEPYFFPFYFLRGFFSIFNLNFKFSLFFIYLLPILVLAPLGSFLLLKKIIKNDFLAFVGGIVYSFNTYFLVLQTQHLTIAFAYAFAPITLLLYFKLIEALNSKKEIYKYLILFSLFASIQVILEPRLFYILLVFFLIGIKCFIKRVNLFYSLLMLIIAFLLASYWLFPFMLSGKDYAQEIISRPLFGEHLKTLEHSLTLSNPSWTKKEPTSFILQPFPLYLWIIPIYILFGLYYSRKNKLLLFIYLVALLGIFLTKQSDYPFQNFYYWLFKNFPGFNLFRESSKFYLLISLSYALLLPFSIKSIVCRIGKNKRNITILLSLPIIFIYLINIIPLINGDIGTMFKGRIIHNEYQLFKNFLINEDVVYGRHLWIPVSTRWAFYAMDRPRISFKNAIINDWKIIFNNTTNDFFIPQSESNALTIYDNVFLNYVLDYSTISYVIIPIKDISNNDNFFIHYGGRKNPDIRNWYISELDKLDYLEKIDIGTEELVVYENKDYKPYITVSNKINGLKSFDKLEEKYSFLNDELNNEFLFYDLNKKDIVSENVYIPFEIINTSNMNEFAVNDLIEDKNDKSKIYINKDKRSVIAKYKNSSLGINKIFNNNLNINNESIDSYNDPIEIYQLDTLGQDLFMEVGSRLISLKNNSQKIDLGIVVKPFDIYSVDEDNAIRNASFENGAWSEKVGDCNAYDDKAILAMEISDESTEGKESIQLEAVSHIACTGQSGILVKGGQDYIFGFDYQGKEAKHAGYYVKFNDEFSTVISERLPINNEEWNHFQKKIAIPIGSTKMSLVIYSYAKDNKTNVITRYDNFQLKQLEKIATVDPKYKAEYEAIALSGANEYNIEYKEKNKTYDNLIKNPSFEKGLWSNRVGDCNNYDDNGRLSMQHITEEKSDGEYSLQLGATRHIACTGPGMLPITEERTYLFSFDYQSPNGKRAGYYLGFNDPDRTVISERIPIKDDKWQNYTKQIKAPYGASAVSLVIYSYASDGKKEIITRYDNFSFIELPDLEDRYFLVSEPEEKFVKPESVEFELINPTKKKVHIKGASTGFYLAMSESYHDQWQLQMNNKKINGFFNKWVPWAKPDRIPDDQHFELNGFLNGWFVDLDICRDVRGRDVALQRLYTQRLYNNDSACTLNPDGTYDIEMVIEFWPQRWFYLGLLISGTTFLGCIGYLGWDFIRRRRRLRARLRRGKEKRKNKIII